MIIRKLILIFLFISAILSCIAQVDTAQFIENTFLESNEIVEKQQQYYDKSDVDVKYPKNNKLTDYKQSNDFQYEYRFVEGSSLWDNIIYWVYRQIGLLFSDKGAYPFIRWAIIITFIVFIVLRILDVNVFGFFYSDSKKASTGFSEIDDDISKADINTMIEMAKKDENYRLAVRLLFLKLLQIFDNKKLIIWKQYKTNADYLYELENSAYIENFKQLKYIYEYIWYGDFLLSKKLYLTIEDDFAEVFESLSEPIIAKQKENNIVLEK